MDNSMESSKLTNPSVTPKQIQGRFFTAFKAHVHEKGDKFASYIFHF